MSKTLSKKIAKAKKAYKAATPEPSAEKESYGHSNLTTYGYMVEWRLKPESAAITDLLGVHDVKPEWRKGPYSIEQLGLVGDAQKLIRPCIEKGFGDMERQGLVGRKVAIAIIACMETSLRPKILKHIEWRIVRIKLEKSHTLTRDDDNQAAEEDINTLYDVFREHAA